MIEFEERRADEEVGEIRDLERDGIPISLLPIYESIYIYIYSLHFPINLHGLLHARTT